MRAPSELPQEGEERDVRSSRTPSGDAGLAECTECGRCRPDWSSHWACQDYTLHRVQGTQYSTGPRLERQKTEDGKMEDRL